MSAPDNQQLRELMESVALVLRRQDELDARLAALEGRRDGPAGGRQEVQPPPLPASPPPLPAAGFVPPGFAPPAPQYSQPVYPQQPWANAGAPGVHLNPGAAWTPRTGPAARSAETRSTETKSDGGRNFETAVGLNWVNRVAVFTLLLGAAFLFKYGVDNDWFGPGARVAMGLAAAAISLGAGHRLWRKNQKVFAQGLTALGLALGYLTFWAAASLYHFIPTAVAFLLMFATTGGAAGLALFYESQAIAVLAMLGAYITPFALSTHEDHPWILFGYVFVVNLGALVLARLRTWRIVEPLAMAMTVLIYFGWALSAPSRLDDATRPVATLFAIAYYAQFSITGNVAVWGAIQMFGPLAMALVREHEALPWELVFVVGGLAVSEVRRWSLAPMWTLGAFLFPVWAMLETRNDLGDPNIAAAALTAGFLLFFLWTPWWNLVRHRELRSADLWVMAANAAAYFALTYRELNPHYHAYMGLFAVVVGLMHFVLAQMLKREGARLELGIALAFAALAVPIQFTGLRITAAWALEAAGVAWIAERFHNLWMRLGSALLFLLVLARLMAIDAWVYSSASNYTVLFNARFFAFAIAAFSLFLAAKFTAAVMREAAGMEYAVGHFVLLFGLGLEVAGWVDRSVAEYDQTSMLAVGLSLLMAVYAAGLIAAGIVTRTAINRILGLGLVALVVAKLYLIDVWEVGRVFRITAFLALGGLLLGVSYLYSRFRPSIEKLWKGEGEPAG